MDPAVRRDPGAVLASVNPSSGATSYSPAPGQTPGGLPGNMYANMLAQFQQALQNNYTQQGAQGLRDRQAMFAEALRQENELKRKNKFWNRMGQGLSTGIINTVSSLPGAAVRAGEAVLTSGASELPRMVGGGGMDMTSQVPGMVQKAAGPGAGGMNLGNMTLQPPTSPFGY